MPFAETCHDPAPLPKARRPPLIIQAALLSLGTGLAVVSLFLFVHGASHAAGPAATGMAATSIDTETATADPSTHALRPEAAH